MCSLMESDRGRESTASRSWDLQCDDPQLTLEIVSVSSGRQCSTKSQGKDLGELLNQMEGGGKQTGDLLFKCALLGSYSLNAPVYSFRGCS